MENTLKNIQIVAFFFFFTLGIGYLLSGLMVLNGNFLPTSQTIKESLFLPLIMMGIAYGASSILEGLASEEKNSRIQTTLVVGLALLIAALAIFIHFGIPSAK